MGTMLNIINHLCYYITLYFRPLVNNDLGTIIIYSQSGVLAVTACEYGCADENMTWVRQPFTTTSTTTTLSPMYLNVANATVSTYNEPNEVCFIR